MQQSTQATSSKKRPRPAMPSLGAAYTAPDLMQFSTAAVVRSAPEREAVHYKLQQARYEKADLLDMATVLARQYNVDNTSRGLDVKDTQVRLTPQKAAQQKARSRLIRDHGFADRWVDRCDDAVVRPARLDSSKQQGIFQTLMVNAGTGSTTVSTLLHRTARITGTPTWPVRWTSCGTNQHYHTFAPPDKPIDAATDPTPAFPDEWLAPSKRVRHAVARAEEGVFGWEDDPVVCSQASEPFRPVPLAIRKLVSTQLQQRIENPDISLSRTATPRNVVGEIASTLQIPADAAGAGCACVSAEGSTNASPPPAWQAEDLMRPTSSLQMSEHRCLHMQALETTLGRHTEGVVDGVLHLVMNSLQGYARTVREHTLERNAAEAQERLAVPGAPEGREFRRLRHKLREKLPEVLRNFDPEASDSTFTWEHVMMTLQQHAQHASDASSEVVETHPLLHPLRLTPHTLQRIERRVALVCGDPSAVQSNFDKLHAGETTSRRVNEMVQAVDAEHHLGSLMVQPPSRRSGSKPNSNSADDDDAEGEENGEDEDVGQEILVEVTTT